MRETHCSGKQESPECIQKPEVAARCSHCELKQEKSPIFFSTPASKVLFFFGALLVGSSLSGTLTTMGLYALGVDRLLVDIGFGIAYYCLVSFAFSLLQRANRR